MSGRGGTAAAIRRFIDEELLEEPAEGDPLGVVLDDDEITAEAFASVDAVAALVDAKRSAG